RLLQGRTLGRAFDVTPDQTRSVNSLLSNPSVRGRADLITLMRIGDSFEAYFLPSISFGAKGRTKSHPSFSHCLIPSNETPFAPVPPHAVLKVDITLIDIFTKSRTKDPRYSNANGNMEF